MQRRNSNSGATVEIKPNAFPECPVMLNYNWTPIEINVTSRWLPNEYIMLCDVAVNSERVRNDDRPGDAEVLQTQSNACG